MIVVSKRPAQLLLRRHGVEARRAAVDAGPFVVDEEERPVPAVVAGQHHRTADDEPVLLLIQLRRLGGLVVEEVPGVPAVVPEEAERGAVERVRAGLAHQVDLVGAEPVLRRVGRRLLLELLDRIDRQDGGRRADRRVDVRGAVDHEVVRRRAGAHDADRVADALPHATLLAGRLDGAGAEEQQLQEVPAVERQVGDLLLGDGVPDRGAAGVEHLRARLHVHRLRDVAGIEHDVDALDLVDRERHVRGDGELETGLLTGDHVGADGEQGDDVVAVGPGLRLTGETGLLIGHGHLHVGHDGAGRVAHGPGDLTGGRLGGRRGGQAHDHRQPHAGQRQVR